MTNSKGRKESKFPVVSSLPDGSSITGFNSGVNYSVTYDNFVAGLGVTGTIVQDGDVTGTPILDVTGTVNNIRNIEDGSGIKSQVSPENGIIINHNFSVDATGAPIMGDQTALSPTLRSIVGGANITSTVVGDTVEISTATISLDNRVVVKSASDLSGALDSTKEYFIDGVVDMGSTQIVVPIGGLTLNGYSFEISKLISSEIGHTMLISPVGGSGNLSLRGFVFGATGATAKVFDIVAATGNEAIEINDVNFTDCTSMGTIDGYRQGFESGTGRFGGKPSLELKGTWLGGYRVTSSIIRGVDNTMASAIFKAGAGLTFGSRFLTDINADLGTLAPFSDFAPSNFINPSAFKIVEGIFTRNGVFDSTDSTILPNISSADVKSSFHKNEGISNTFVGGTQKITIETATTITTINTFVDLAGTWSASDLQHFDSPANGQLRHLGNDPREFRIQGDLVIAGPANNVITIKLVKWDNSASIFVDVGTQQRQIISLIGGRDVAFFNSLLGFTLDQNDYIKLQVANNTGTGNLTAETDGFITVMER